MKAVFLLVVGLAASVYSQEVSSGCTANEADVELVAKVVFVYGMTRTEAEKAGIAFTIVNRVADPHFPNTTAEVVSWEVVKPRKTKRCYAKITKRWMVNKWNRAKNSNSEEYQVALRASRSALCGQTADPTSGATDFAAQPTPRRFHAPPNYRASQLGTQLGSLYFFKLQPNAVNRAGRRRPNGHQRNPGRGMRGNAARGPRWRPAGGRPGRRRRPGAGARRFK